MEMRHTIEILVKDIQDIEKLVASLQNYDWPAMEMDLALSKLRNVYEVLTMIRDDRYRTAGNAVMTPGSEAERPGETTAAAAPEPETGQSAASPEEPEAGHPAAAPEPEAGHSPAAPEPEAGHSPAAPEEPARVQGAEQPPSQPEAAATKTGPEPVSAPNEETGHPVQNGPPVQNGHPGSNRMDNTTTESDRMDSGKMDSGKVAAILAEKFSREASINENMANQRNTSMESRFAGKPIDNIARNIGINDRFMIIRELFNGNSEDYSRLIRYLDEAGDYEKAMKLIREQFPASMDHNGVGILIGLTRRKFVRT